MTAFGKISPAGGTGIDPERLLERARIVKDSRSVKAGICGDYFVKRYNRRGFFHDLKRLFQVPRPLRCRRAAACLAARGFPTPEVCFASRHWLVTRLADGEFGSVRLPDPALTGRTLAGLHALNFIHGDASMRNFYFAAGSPVLGVIDLDGARIFRRRIPQHLRLREIARAVSSWMIMSGHREETAAIPKYLDEFLAAYNSAGGGVRPSPGLRRRILKFLKKTRT